MLAQYAVTPRPIEQDFADEFLQVPFTVVKEY